MSRSKTIKEKEAVSPSRFRTEHCSKRLLQRIVVLRQQRRWLVLRVADSFTQLNQARRMLVLQIGEEPLALLPGGTGGRPEKMFRRHLCHVRIDGHDRSFIKAEEENAVAYFATNAMQRQEHFPLF